MVPQAQKAVNTLVPISAASIAGYIAYRQKADWKMLLIIMIAVYILALVITKQTTKLISGITDKPPAIDIPQAVGGAIPASFDANGWARQIRDDVYTVFALRNHELYASLAAMNESQLVAIYNAWNRLYFYEHKESLVQAMQAEVYGDGWSVNTGTNAKNIIQRLQALIN